MKKKFSRFPMQLELFANMLFWLQKTMTCTEIKALVSSSLFVFYYTKHAFNSQNFGFTENYL